MRVLVTRPAREATAWVSRLRARGVDAHALPLIAIGPPPDDAALQAARAQLPTYAAVMFVSGNAVRGFLREGWSGTAAAAVAPAGLADNANPTPDADPGRPALPRCWAPGPGTRDALLAAGVPAASIDAPGAGAASFDSEALWEVVRAGVRPGQRILLVRGGAPRGDGGVAGAVPGEGDAAAGQGRDWLAARLREAGATVVAVAAYTRTLPQWSPADCALAQAAAADGSLWLLSSAQAVAHLRLLLPGQGWADARALASHARIEQAARAAGFGRVTLCRPAFDDVVASIESAR